MTSRTIVGAMVFVAAAPLTGLGAQEVTVRGQLERPVWYADTALLLRHDQMLANQRWVEGSFQVVNFYQPGSFHPIYCGTTTTDAFGAFEDTVECGGSLPGELYAEVQGISSRGFTVGTFDEDGFYASLISSLGFATVAAIASGAIVPVAAGASAGLLTEVMKRLDGPPEIFVWSFFDDRVTLGPGQTTVDFGTLRIGGGSGNPSPNEDWAAAVLEGVDFSYRHLNPFGFQPTDPIFPPAWSNWVINNPFFGPTTVWTTVHLNQPFQTAAGIVIGWQQSMGALPHELGHVLYNVRHSGEDHWLVDDGPNYLRTHQECQAWSRYNLAFAHYEGFANAIRALVWRDHAIDRGAGPGVYPTQFDCAFRGLIDEGEASDLYVRMYHATGMDRTSATLKTATPVALGTDSLGLVGIPFLFEMVAAAGPTAHTPLAFWQRFLETACDATVAGVPAYCGSRRYRCWAADSVANPGELPMTFFDDSCLPGQSQITNVAAPPVGTAAGIIVTFTSADFVDGYEVYQSTAPPIPFTAGAAWSGGASPSGPVATPGCQPRQVWVVTRNRFGVTASDPADVLRLNTRGCRPGLSNVTAVDPQMLAIACFDLGLHDSTAGPTSPEEHPGEPHVPGPPMDSTAGQPNDSTDDEPPLLPSLMDQAFYRVRYTSAPDAQSYQVRYSPTGSGAAAGESPWWNATAQVIPLEQGATYQIRIATRNDFGTAEGAQYTYTAAPRESACYDTGKRRFRRISWPF